MWRQDMNTVQDMSFPNKDWTTKSSWRYVDELYDKFIFKKHHGEKQYHGTLRVASSHLSSKSCLQAPLWNLQCAVTDGKHPGDIEICWPDVDNKIGTQNQAHIIFSNDNNNNNNHTVCSYRIIVNNRITLKNLQHLRQKNIQKSQVQTGGVFLSAFHNPLNRFPPSPLRPPTSARELTVYVAQPKELSAKVPRSYVPQAESINPPTGEKNPTKTEVDCYYLTNLDWIWAEHHFWGSLKVDFVAGPGGWVNAVFFSLVKKILRGSRLESTAGAATTTIHLTPVPPTLQLASLRSRSSAAAATSSSSSSSSSWSSSSK